MLKNRVCRPIQNSMHIDNNIIVDIWDYLKPVLAVSIEALFILLSFPDNNIHKSLLLIDKYYDSLCLCKYTQLGCLVNSQDLDISILDKNEKKFYIYYSQSSIVNAKASLYDKVHSS